MIKFDDNGLVPVVVQDHVTSEVLMVAWANQEALDMMDSTGYTHFWSRSRNKLWKKGEESGHVQRIVSVQMDCDDDTLLVRVIPEGPACHTGEPACFYKTLSGSLDGTSAVIPRLRRIINDRKVSPKEGSYTSALMDDENRMCKKVIEEAGEFCLAVKDGDAEEMAWELADMIYHTMVAVEKTGLPMEKVFQKLTERMR